MLPAASYIIGRDNLNSHKLENVKSEKPSASLSPSLLNSLRLVLITLASVHNHESAAARPVLDHLSRVSQAESCRKTVL